MKKIITIMKTLHNCILLIYVALILVCLRRQVCYGQGYTDQTTGDAESPPAPPPGQDTCNGIFLTYTFMGRELEYPHVKNASAQSWAFKATATILNADTEELKSWKMFIGFRHKEILVSATGGSIIDGSDFPVAVDNGTTFIGNPQVNLKTAIETAGDIDQISAKIEIKGTQFGVKPPAIPMPKSLKLINDGYLCPAAEMDGSYMYTCCKKNPKYKASPEKKTKFAPLQSGDLTMNYDVLQAYGNNYLAQVTMENVHPLGRLDHWNLTWEWQNNEFIYNMRGAFTHKKDISGCLYGPAGKLLQDFDFSQVMNCEKRPIISDLPAAYINDTKLGRLPYCCRNGILLPKLMDEAQSKSVFQLQVYKLPPNDNRTALVPPMKWQINGDLNPNYKCGPPVRVDPTEFPDPSGLQATTNAVASWQVVCNITKLEDKQSRCCVTFSAYYNDSIIPCPTCACGCPDNDKCNPKAKAMLMPSDALLVPFSNRTDKVTAWAGLKHLRVPKPMPCPDNCGVSINWHINTDYRDGWSGRITIFNWDTQPFEDWFLAVKMDKTFLGYENVYSFNGTELPKQNKTLFFQGLKGLNYLVGLTNGTKPSEPKVPGKQQSVISFLKKNTPNANIQRGDGFPTKVFFNGEECALPKDFPQRGAAHKSAVNVLLVIFTAVVTFVLMQDRYFPAI